MSLLSSDTCSRICLYKYHARSATRPLGFSTRGIPSKCNIHWFFIIFIVFSSVDGNSLIDTNPGFVASNRKWWYVWNFSEICFKIRFPVINLYKSLFRNRVCYQLGYIDFFLWEVLTTRANLKTDEIWLRRYFNFIRPKHQSGSKQVWYGKRNDDLIF